jgi:short-subunit dehydrogenase
MSKSEVKKDSRRFLIARCNHNYYCTENYYAGKIIWIIGGTSGIGLALALKLAAAAKKVIISGRFAPDFKNDPEDEDLQKQEPQAIKNIHFIKCDVTQLPEFKKAMLQIKNDYNQLDILIFCAGIYEPMNYKNFNLVKAQEILTVNFGSFLHLIASLDFLLKELKLSSLVVVSSIAGYFGMPNSMCYGASKAALSNITEGLHYELKNILKIQLVNPGFVKTRLTDKNSFKMPFLLSKEKAAKIILKNLAKNKFEISFPLRFSFFMKLVKILPYKLKSQIFRPDF